MKKMRKILATIVSLCLVLAMMPTLPVFADGNAGTDPVFATTWEGGISLDWLDSDYESTDNDYVLTELASYENVKERKYQEYGGKYYKINDFASGTTFIIDSAEDLAGLAALVSSGETHHSQGWFKNCTLKITKNLDLGTTEWQPIGKDNNHDFCGMLVGALDGVDGASIIIKNMKVDHNNNCGLVGTVRGGGIKNITLQNASVKNTANSTGSFVGYVAAGNNVYENLKSDAVITATAGDADGPTGGILGYTNVAGVKVVNCDFTGSINNNAKKTGGIVGLANNSIEISDCSVDAEITATHAYDGLLGGIVGHAANANTKISNCSVTGTFNNNGVGRTGGVVGFAAAGATVSNVTVSGTISSPNGVGYDSNGAKKERGGVGGIGGLVRGTFNVTKAVVTANITGADKGGTGGIAGLADKDEAVVTIRESYVGGTLAGAYVVGGFLGNAIGTHIIENCQFDGIVNSTHTQNGAFVGRFNATAAGAKLTMTNCLNTGFAMNTRAEYDTAFSWIGLSANNNGSAVYTFTSCYSNTDIPFAGRCDASSSTASWTFNVNGTEETVSSPASFRGLAKFKPTSLSFFEMKPEKLTGFDFTNVWTERDGKIPTLKSAADSASDTYAYADLSFFKVNTADKSVEVLEINDEHKLLGLLKLSKAATDATKFTLKLSRTLDYTGMGFSDAWETALAGAYVGSVDATGAKIVRTALQKGNTTETASSIRLVAEISGKNYDAAGFDVLMSYVDAQGVTHYSKAQTKAVTKCYTSLLANGAKVEPASGNYFIIVEITDPLVALDQITVTFNAFVTEGNVTTYSADVLEIAL